MWLCTSALESRSGWQEAIVGGVGALVGALVDVAKQQCQRIFFCSRLLKFSPSTATCASVKVTSNDLRPL